MNKSFDNVVQPKIGILYHLSWASPGCKFVLCAIFKIGNLHYATLMTPAGGKLITTELKNLRHLRGHSTI